MYDIACILSSHLKVGILLSLHSRFSPLDWEFFFPVCKQVLLTLHLNLNSSPIQTWCVWNVCDLYIIINFILWTLWSSFLQAGLHWFPIIFILLFLYLWHGKKWGSVALIEYKTFVRTPVKVIPSGSVVSQKKSSYWSKSRCKSNWLWMCWSFGLAQVKCPFTKHHVTPLDTCTDPVF